MEITHLLQDTAKRFKDKPAIIYPGPRISSQNTGAGKDKQISFEQLSQNVFKVANALRALGIKKHDKVGIYLPNCPEYVYSYLAIFCLGATGVPLDYMLKADELISCLSHSEAKFLIAKPNDVSLDQIKAGVSSLEKIILSETLNGFLATTSDRFTPETISPKDPSLIMYTSGTTGKPKGILLNYRHLNGSTEAMKYFVDLTDKDVKLCALPLSHIGGFIYIQNCITFGIPLVLMGRFNPFEFLGLIEQFKVTCFHIVPPMYAAILSLKEIERFDLSSLRWVVVFGAPSSPDMLRRFHQHCPNAKFLNGWGMTETCPPNTVTPLNSDKIESVGRTSPNSEIKIFDENDKEVSHGHIGEIVIKGWVVMDGYYKDPDGTKELMKDGWFHTGDLGRFDDEGFLYIIGRKKEMIKVGGQIVYAPEVEAALQKHPSVSEVAVIGIPDKLRGEAVKAFVVLREKNRISSNDLKYFIKEHLAHFKIPQEIELRDVLPKNRTGKVDKEQLKYKAVPT